MQHRNWTHSDYLSYSNSSATEGGLWIVSRDGLSPLQNFTLNDTIWLLYTNENSTMTYSSNCTTDSGIAGPYQSNTTIRNLLYPFETYILGAAMNRPFYYDGKAPYFGCIESITMQPFDYKALVPSDSWVTPIPAFTKFTPGNDARIEVNANSSNTNSIDVQIEFLDLMDCDSITQSMNFTIASSRKASSSPLVNLGLVQCQMISDGNLQPIRVIGATISRWYWNGTIDKVADGILMITINNPQSQGGVEQG